MEQGKPNNKGKDPARRRNTAETILWLLIIISLAIIVLQGIGYLELFTLSGKWAIIGLIFIGAGLAAAALNGFIQSSRLKAALKRLSEQQLKRSIPVTFDNGEGEEQAIPINEEAQIWKEKVKFSAVIEERQRLARELHDAVSQQLFAISMTATAVSRTIERDWERARRQVQLIEEMAAVAQSEMRALLLHLRPVHLDGKSLGQALYVLIEELQQKVPMNIQLEVDESIKLHADAEDHLFRIAQEALSNALRHSKAERMDIKLQRCGDEVHMIILDDGIGFDVEAKKSASYGLLTMAERVQELGGGLELNSKIGEGTSIHIWVPVNGFGE